MENTHPNYLNNLTHAIMRDYYIFYTSDTLKQFDNFQEADEFYDNLV